MCSNSPYFFILPNPICHRGLVYSFRLMAVEVVRGGGGDGNEDGSGGDGGGGGDVNGVDSGCGGGGSGCGYCVIQAMGLAAFPNGNTQNGLLPGLRDRILLIKNLQPFLLYFILNLFPSFGPSISLNLL